MHRRKAALPAKGQGLLQFSLGLAGKSHDQVCGEGAAREALPEEGHTLHITGGVILPAHPDKDGVAAVLETQVELGAQVGEAG